MEPANVPVRIAFSDDRFYPQLLYGSTCLRAFLLCLEPGQGLPPRADSEETVCYVISGRGRLTLGDRVLTVTTGDIAAAAPGEKRGLEADVRMTALWLHIGARAERDA